MAGKRPFWIASGLACLDLGSLGHFQGIFNLDTEIPDSALDFGVPKEQLDGSQVTGSPIDQSRLGPAQ